VSKKLILNSISGSGLYFINIIVAFVMSPVMVKTLGNSDYGLWEMVISVVGYMGLLDLGVGPALLRHVAIAHGNGDKQDLQETMSTAMVFFIGIGILAILVFLGLSEYPQILTGNVTNGREKIALVLILFAANAGLVCPLNVYTGILMGLQKHHLINYSRSILTISRSAVAFYMLYQYPGKGLLILATLEIASNVIQFSVYATALGKDDTVPRFSPLKCSIQKMSDLFRYGAKSSLLMLASRLQFASMPFIIGKSLGLGFIVYFVLPNRLVDYAKGFAMAIGFPLTPYFANIIGKEEQDLLKESWLTTAFLLQIVTLAMPLYLYFCGEKFLYLWIGPEYALAGQLVLYALLIGLTVEALIPNARQILLAKAQHGGIAVVCLVMSICSIPLAIIGAKMFGVAGVALGSSLTTVIISAATLIMTCQIMHTSPAEYLVKTLLPLLVPLGLLGIALWAGEQLLHPHNYFSLMLQVVFGTTVYLFAVWKVSLPESMRAKFVGTLSQKITRKR
jgi:O-antigen/teichoic acid export membrane protein